MPGLAWLPGAGLGTEEGAICGKRLDALPAGIVVETPGTPAPTTGIVPMGRLVPRLKVVPAAPAPATVALGLLPPFVGPGEEPVPADFAVLELGAGDAGAFATVTVGAVAVAVSGEPLPLGTETVAANLIVSPAGAVLGTLTSASICGTAGCFAGRVRSQLAVVGLLVQLSTVNVGWLNAGVFAPGVRAVAMVPFSDELDQAEIRNRTVPPGCTLFADAMIFTLGAVAVAVAVGVGVGVGVGLVAEGDGDGAALEGVAGLPGTVAAGEDDLVAVALLDGVTLLVAAALDDAAALLVAAALLEALVLDGAAEADGVAAAMAVPVIPLEMTKRPVARPSVTGRVCGDRMRTPCLCLL